MAPTRKDLDNIPEPDLRNQIDPIFRDFAGKQKDPEPILLALRLASHLIEAAFPIFYTIISQAQELKHKESEEGESSQTSLSYPEPSRTLTRAQRTSVRDFLDTYLVGHVVIVPSDEVVGSVKAMSGPEGLFKGRNSGQFCCEIAINKANLDRMQVAYDIKAYDRPLYLWLSLALATVLVHELTHCVIYASKQMEVTLSNGQYQPALEAQEWFLGSANCAEIGLELENRLFGGIIDPRSEPELQGPRYFFEEEPSGIEKALYSTEWPNYAHARTYQTGDLPLAIREGYIIPKEYRVWPVDFDHLAKLFQEDFWQGFDDLSRARNGEDPLGILRFPKQNPTTLTYAPPTGS